MKKKLINIITILILVIILFPIVFYITIVITNNCIADGIEKDLKAINLPANTEFVDSLSIAGKISGNGNGMQYLGAILVSSELSEDELKEYYKKHSQDIEVVKQETAIVFDDHYLSRHSFKNFDPDKNNYMVHCWEYNDSDWKENDFISELLDFDLRGH